MSRAERITVDSDTVAPRAQHMQNLASQVKPLTLARDLTLPLAPALAPLFPSGSLRRGTTVVVASDASGLHQGATTLALALAAQASLSGSWSAAIAFPDLGVLAAAELNLELDRLALIPDVPPAQWVNVVAALVDSVDIVLVRPPPHLRQGDARRLSTRTRERGAVLIPVLGGLVSGGGPWIDGADIRLRVTDTAWEGPGAGEGRLQHREVTVAAGGRGAAARERRIRLELPSRRVHQAEKLEEEPSFAGSDADRLPDRSLEPNRSLRSAG